MQKCPNCGQQNRPGVIFCENCGASLIGKLPLSTRALDSIESELPDIGVDASTVTDVSIQGTATFEHGMLVRLEVEGSPDPIRFNPGSETIFGRRDPATGDKPIETIGEVGKTALTGGTSTVLKQAANAAGLTGTTATAEKAATAATGSACADGSCAVPAAK